MDCPTDSKKYCFCEGLTFNSKPSTVMHIDLNSCFASIEQQANPLLRGKPVAVAAYATPRGCIIAPSVEAKKNGVKVGMRVGEGKSICPDLIILPPDPWKYRFIHLKLRNLLAGYTNRLVPKSIDEFVLDFDEYPVLSGSSMRNVAGEIKLRIKREIGEWIRVSIGIAPNRFLAKLASSFNKPDGLDEIDRANFLNCYLGLELTDLPYIKLQNAARLNSMGIFTVLDFYNAPLWRLKAAFRSVCGYYWYLRLRGWEIDDVDFTRRSFGNSYALPNPLSSPREISPILSKLVEKMGSRLRKSGYRARGVHLAVFYKDGYFWHRGKNCGKIFFDSRDIFREAFGIFCESPYKKPIRNLAVSVFDLVKKDFLQLEIFSDISRKRNLIAAVDIANEKWGSFVVTPGRMLGTNSMVHDRISFGSVKEIEDFAVNHSH